MQLYYFGTAEKPLFGVHHPAQGRTKRSQCVVLCPPIGTELLRSYRAFRQLASMLAKQGYDVLRFDYYGTGDSSGDCVEGTLQQWHQDIHTAIEELKEVSGTDQVSLVGLRLGATLVAGVAKSDEISRVILWEPVIDGSAYLQDRIDTDQFYETAIGHEELTAKRLEEGEPIGIMGFALSAELRAELNRIDVNHFKGINSERTYLLVREESESTEQLQKVLQDNAGKFGYEHIEHPGEWGEFDAIGSLLLPQATIQAVIACLL